MQKNQRAGRDAVRQLCDLNLWCVSVLRFDCATNKRNKHLCHSENACGIVYGHVHVVYVHCERWECKARVWLRRPQSNGIVKRKKTYVPIE